jgi:hypothetical protein
MRYLDEHKIDKTNEAITISVQEDQEGPGDRVYNIEGFATLKFQSGPLNEDGSGLNGITNEALLVIVADRLRMFQEGDFKCAENEHAVEHVEHALYWLEQRSLGRVTGTSAERVFEL